MKIIEITESCCWSFWRKAVVRKT